MIKNTLFLIIILFNTISLSAKEEALIKVESFCTDPYNIFTKLFFTDIDTQMYTIKFSHKDLYLSEDAIEENPSGYVTIREDKHYFKSGDKVYNLKGKVERVNSTNKFTAHIYNKKNKLINIDELHKLKDYDDIKYIQKITLKNGGNKTNLLDVSFDKDLYDLEYKKCHDQINQSQYKLYIQFFALLLILFFIFFLLKKR